MTDVADTYPPVRAEAYPTHSADAPKQDNGARAERCAASAVRHVALRVDPSQMRNVHRELAQRLGREAGVRVSLGSRAATPLPPAVDLLLQLEHHVFHLSGRKLGDRLDFDQTLALEQSASDNERSCASVRGLGFS